MAEREQRTELLAFLATPTTKERVERLAAVEELTRSSWLNRTVSAVVREGCVLRVAQQHRVSP